VPYVHDDLSDADRALLAPFVTDLDGPVFALTGLPEVVKGAVFARYSRSPKPLRRLLADEFAEDLRGLQAGSASAGEAAISDGRATALYERVFGDYGDDSVAQLGGAHAAVEQASNLLTKQLEWGRLAAYLEQSTRYIPYDDRPGGRYRYHRDADVMASRHADAYERELDGIFDTYRDLLPRVRAWAEERFPRDETTSPGAYRATITAKTCDLLRGLLPAATVSNVGIFASGQAWENLLLRLRSSELAETRATGDALLVQLRAVIPSFLTRVDRPDRGGVWSEYLASTRTATRAAAEALTVDVRPQAADEVTLVAWSDDAEVELVVGMLYPHTHLPEAQLRQVVEAMGAEERRRVVQAYVGDRRNRRHKPGRALERVWYRFDVCGDYGAFRDLQRHRMLTIEWQDLSPLHGHDLPPELVEAGVDGEYARALERSAALWERLHADLPLQAQYAVSFAYRLRYSLQLNARAAMQMLELRTQPQGHPSYRRVCQRMHTLIRDVAGHHAVADMLRFVDHGTTDLERLEAERALDARRAARSG
jgi:thymidylate synthase ThyX